MASARYTDQLAASYGFSFAGLDGSNHRVYRHHSGALVRAASTPSDFRDAANFVATLRRAAGDSHQGREAVVGVRRDRPVSPARHAQARLRAVADERAEHDRRLRLEDVVLRRERQLRELDALMRQRPVA